MWGCELLGTALLLAGGLSAVFLDFGPGSPVARAVPSISLRFLLTGTVFAGTGSLVALSPVGRLSGAHLNPAVTIAFYLQRKVHVHDLLGYVAAQLLGALVAAAGLRLAWGVRRPRCMTVRPSRGAGSAAPTRRCSRR